MASLRCITELASLDDEALVARFHGGDEAALDLLIARYRRLARSKSRLFFVLGADQDDVEQEALIGLFKAARDYRFDRDTSFRSFAEVCVSRQVVTAIKAGTCQKHQPLNRSTPLESIGVGPSGDDHERHVALGADPVDEVLRAEQLESFRHAVVQALSGFEVAVLRLFSAGRSYAEISVQLDRSAKSVDNALQRIRRKLAESYGRSEPDGRIPLAA